MAAITQATTAMTTDPYSRKKYSEAQKLDCGHHVSRSTALKIFGIMKDGVIERPGLCPKCSRQCTKYVPDPEFQNLVDRVQWLVEKDVSPPVPAVASTEEQVMPQGYDDNAMAELLRQSLREGDWCEAIRAARREVEQYDGTAMEQAHLASLPW